MFFKGVLWSICSTLIDYRFCRRNVGTKRGRDTIGLGKKVYNFDTDSKLAACARLYGKCPPESPRCSGGKRHRILRLLPLWCARGYNGRSIFPRIVSNCQVKMPLCRLLNLQLLYSDSNLQLIKTMMVFGAAFACRPIGGALIGKFGDMFGRYVVIYGYLYLTFLFLSLFFYSISQR